MPAGHPFRIALRAEGEWWVAYVAKPSDMDGAIEIARVRLKPAKEDPKVKQAFIDFAQLVVDSTAEAKRLGVVGWNAPIAAPESEKADSE